MITADELVEAARALGARDVVARAGRVITLCTVLADAQRMRRDAVHAAVALDALFPRADHAWRPVCCLCVDALDVASSESGGPEVEVHRINRDSGHDTGCCSFCGFGGHDTLVASIDDQMFAAPTAEFLEIRCRYGDRGGRLATFHRKMIMIDLKPRAIAALCTLRSGPKTANQIGTAIGDGSTPAGRRATADLLVDMQRPGMDLIAQHEGRYYLDHDGLGWLQSHGLDAVKEARIWNVIDGVGLAKRALERGERSAKGTTP